jgi:hypothetical protein
MLGKSINTLKSKHCSGGSQALIHVSTCSSSFSRFETSLDMFELACAGFSAQPVQSQLV